MADWISMQFICSGCNLKSWILCPPEALGSALPEFMDPRVRSFHQRWTHKLCAGGIVDVGLDDDDAAFMEQSLAAGKVLGAG